MYTVVSAPSVMWTQSNVCFRSTTANFVQPNRSASRINVSKSLSSIPVCNHRPEIIIIQKFYNPLLANTPYLKSTSAAVRFTHSFTNIALISTSCRRAATICPRPTLQRKRVAADLSQSEPGPARSANTRQPSRPAAHAGRRPYRIYEIDVRQTDRRPGRPTDDRQHHP